MKKAVLLIIYLLGCFFSSAEAGNQLLNDIEAKPEIKIEKCLAENIYSSECLDNCSGINRTSTECVEYLKNFSAWEYENNKAYYDRWLDETIEQTRQKRITTFLIWFGGCLVFGCICFVVSRMVRNKIVLRIKQHTGKHTLDDVFFLEKRNNYGKENIQFKKTGSYRSPLPQAN